MKCTITCILLCFWSYCISSLASTTILELFFAIVGIVVSKCAFFLILTNMVFILEFYMKQDYSFILNFVFSFLLFFILSIICFNKILYDGSLYQFIIVVNMFAFYNSKNW